MFGSDFFIDIGITVILRVLSTKKIPSGYVKAFVKLRDALNLVFPNSGPSSSIPAKNVDVV